MNEQSQLIWTAQILYKKAFLRPESLTDLPKGCRIACHAQVQLLSTAMEGFGVMMLQERSFPPIHVPEAP